MLLCELLQLLYNSFSSLCNFDPICNIAIYFLLVLNFATVICALSINAKLQKKKILSLTSTTEAQALGKSARGLLEIWREEAIAYVAPGMLLDYFLRLFEMLKVTSLYFALYIVLLLPHLCYNRE